MELELLEKQVHGYGRRMICDSLTETIHKTMSSIQQEIQASVSRDYASAFKSRLRPG